MPERRSASGIARTRTCSGRHTPTRADAATRAGDQVMGISPYLQDIRAAIGTRLLVLPAVVGLVFDDDGRLLLVHQRETNLWSTPGGSMEPDETPADAVIREVWEETGLVTVPVRIVGVYGGTDHTITYPHGDVVQPVSTVFECVPHGGALLQRTDETSAAEFVAPRDLTRYAMSPWLRKMLPEFCRRGTSGHFDPPSWQPPRLQP